MGKRIFRSAVVLGSLAFAAGAGAGVSSTMPDLTYNGRTYKDWSYDF